MILPFDVNQQTVSRSAVTSIPRKGSREYLYLSFTFSDDWTDLTKTLYVSSETYSDGIIIEEGVPVQVPTYYTQQNSFSITLCGIKGNEFVPTNIVTVLLEESNDTWEEIAPDPESIPYQQLIAMVQKAIESMHAPYINTETKTWMQWSIEQNMFVDTGIVAVGAQGAPGADGHTPVKGTDYWTDADKTEIVNDVLANIPTGGGETWETILSATADGETVSYVNSGYAYSEIEAYIVIKTGFTNQQNIYFTSGSKGTIFEDPRIFASVAAGWTGQIKLSKKIINAGLIESEIILSNYANPMDISGAKSSAKVIQYGTNYSTPFNLESFSGHTIITQSGEAFPAGTIIFVRGR